MTGETEDPDANLQAENVERRIVRDLFEKAAQEALGNLPIEAKHIGQLTSEIGIAIEIHKNPDRAKVYEARGALQRGGNIARIIEELRSYKTTLVIDSNTESDLCLLCISVLARHDKGTAKPISLVERRYLPMRVAGNDKEQSKQGPGTEGRRFDDEREDRGVLYCQRLVFKREAVGVCADVAFGFLCVRDGVVELREKKLRFSAKDYSSPWTIDEKVRKGVEERKGGRE